MGICVSCRGRERKAQEKRSASGRPELRKGAAAELLPRREVVLEAMANSISNMKMTNPIKGIVSKRRKRYIKDGFNLDLAYITDRVIAMGFPAEKLEGVYRNHIDEVYRFLEQKHRDHYKIYNLCSERSYDSAKFHERVERYAFEDHTPPKIELIQQFCEDVHRWLSAHPRNVAAVHCKAGKGRTGTMVCCYLLFSGQKETAEEALNYYGTTRTHDEKGVTIPSQRRYVQYYERLVRGAPHVQYRPVALHVRELVLRAPPALPAPPALHLAVRQLHPPREAPTGCYEIRKCDAAIRMPLNHCTPVAGDVRVELYHKPKMMRKEKLFHFWFNTFFVANGVQSVKIPPPNDGTNLETFKLTLTKKELDDAHKDKSHKNFPPDFKVELILQKQPDTSKFSGQPSSNCNAVVSPPSSSESSCSEQDDEPDEHWDSGEQTNEPYYCLLDETSSNRSTIASITDLTDGKIPKVSSDHTISFSERSYQAGACKSPTETSKKKFFKKESSEEEKECDRKDFMGLSKPRLSLGEMRASWREFSGKHFGSEHGKQKKKNGRDSKDEG